MGYQWHGVFKVQLIGFQTLDHGEFQAQIFDIAPHLEARKILFLKYIILDTGVVMVMTRQQPPDAMSHCMVSPAIRVRLRVRDVPLHDFTSYVGTKQPRMCYY